MIDYEQYPFTPDVFENDPEPEREAELMALLRELPQYSPQRLTERRIRNVNRQSLAASKDNRLNDALEFAEYAHQLAGDRVRATRLDAEVSAVKCNVLGVGVDPIAIHDVVDRVIHAAKGCRQLSVTSLTTHGLLAGVRNLQHMYRLNHIDLLVPSSKSLRFAVKQLHGYVAEEPSGLTLQICESAAKHGIPIFLYGATDNFTEMLCQRFDGIEIAGRRALQFRALALEERDDLLSEIRGSGAQILLVGMGSWQQEAFVYQTRNLLNMPCIAVGSDMLHAWTKKAGHEWLSQLVMKPRFLRSYVMTYPSFVVRVLLQWIGLTSQGTQAGSKPTKDVFIA